MREQRLQLGAEEEPPIVQHRVVERLLAEPVARQEHRALRLIPEREGEHPVEVPNAILAPLLPGVDDDFGVAARAEGVAERLQLVDQLGEIVDLAVERDAHRAVLVEQRLSPERRKIDDREPAMAEADTGGQVEAAVVGAAMVQRVGHALKSAPIDGSLPSHIEYAGYPAHRPKTRCSEGFNRQLTTICLRS